MIAAGGTLRERAFERLDVEKVQRVLESATTTEPSQKMKERLVAFWPQFSDKLRRELDNRAKGRVQSLESKLNDRAKDEKEKLAAVLTELRKSIESELNDPSWQQGELFPELERRQLEENIDTLRTRLGEIPAELERETAAITARYADRKTHLFPVAVTWIVPEKLARG